MTLKLDHSFPLKKILLCVEHTSFTKLLVAPPSPNWTTTLLQKINEYCQIFEKNYKYWLFFKVTQNKLKRLKKRKFMYPTFNQIYGMHARYAPSFERMCDLILQWATRAKANGIPCTACCSNLIRLPTNTCPLTGHLCTESSSIHYIVQPKIDNDSFKVSHFRSSVQLQQSFKRSLLPLSSPTCTFTSSKPAT